jgi:FMN phosphatase YigB (HAD superfamily)
MFTYALYKAGIDMPLWAIHAGDQVRSDVVGAERAGYRAAVVTRPVGKGDDPFVRLFGRPFFEPVLRYQRSLPILSRNFPDALPDYAYRSCR